MQLDLFPEQIKQLYREGDCFDLSKPPLSVPTSDKFWAKTNRDRINFLLDLPEDSYYIFRNVDGKPAVLNKNTGKYVKANYSRDVYPAVTINKKLLYIHTLVAIFFLENDSPELKCIVDHINHDPWDYRVENLEWVTASENIKRGRTSDKPHHGFNRHTGETL